MEIKQVNIKDLNPYPNNPRANDQAVDAVAESIKQFGFKVPIVIDKDNVIITGHTRLKAATKLGLKTVPVILADDLTPDQVKAFRLADNKTGEIAVWDFDKLEAELNDIDMDMEDFGFDGIDIPDPPAGVEHSKMADKYIYPPFSVLNAREGYWQERKRQWMALGIKSEVGRGDNALGFSEASRMPHANMANANDYGRDKHIVSSIFDPVLTELIYKWFCPENGVILDPFAGGSVRGIVASLLGNKYIGIELRTEQIVANNEQKHICNGKIEPEWIEGDSKNIEKLCTVKKVDFLFSCPPYADLEVYSDNENDLSTMDYPNFKDAYFDIIKKCCSILDDDCFACFVVGEIRDKKGNYYNFVSDTIRAFTDAGLEYYNEIILVTAIGSLPIRAGRIFNAGRKIGKTHQNILVFLKGDAKKATEKIGDIDVNFPETE